MFSNKHILFFVQHCCYTGKSLLRPNGQVPPTQVDSINTKEDSAEQLGAEQVEADHSFDFVGV